jgi:hypothetical protein
VGVSVSRHADRRAPGSRWTRTVSESVSLPQMFGRQPKISASTTAVPRMNARPAGLAVTRTVTSWPLPVQPKVANPDPAATPLLTRWVTVTKTWTGSEALQVISSGTSTAAQRATSRAGSSTWTSRNSPPEEKATAGPVGASTASEPAASSAIRMATATLRRSFMELLGGAGTGGWGAGAGSTVPASTVTASTTAGRCQTKSKPAWTANAAAAATTPAQGPRPSATAPSASPASGPARAHEDQAAQRCHGGDGGQQRTDPRPRHPGDEHGEDQPGGQAGHGGHRPGRGGGRQRRHQPGQGHHGTRAGSGRGPDGRPRAAEAGQHGQPDHERDGTGPAERHGQPAQQPGGRDHQQRRR